MSLASLFVNTVQLELSLFLEQSFAQTVQQWITSLRHSTNPFTNNEKVIAKLQNALNESDMQRYVSNSYDQRIYTGLDIADKISLATGVAGLTRYAATRGSAYLATRQTIQQGRKLGDNIRGQRGSIGDSSPKLQRIHSDDTDNTGHALTNINKR